MTINPLLAEHCVCPACHGSLDWGPDAAACSGCGEVYPCVDGIPILIAARDHHKREQAAFFDAQPAEWETERPHGAPALYRWLIEEKFRRSVAGLESLLPRATALTVCGGSGMDAEMLARRGARVIASDISLGAARRALERSRRHGAAIAPIVADAEALPFRDRAIDLAYVHDGLHHLAEPLTGLREMTRVSARAVAVTEPARAVATRVAVALGISEVEEDAGNRVERVDPGEVVASLRAAGLQVCGADRYAMYYRHEPGPAVRLLSAPGLFALARGSFRLANIPLGPLGNKLTVRAVKATDRVQAPVPIGLIGGPD